MARTTVYNSITNEDSLSKILQENRELMDDFLDYLRSIDRSEGTIVQYRSDLKIFFVWNAELNKNKRFTEITKREFARFQSHAMNEWQWSPKRVRRVKSALSSLSNYIEDILDEEEEYEGYRSVVRKIENPVNEPVREKTIISDEEVQMVLDKLVENGKYQVACVFALAAFGGARKSELLRYKVSYFNEENIMKDAALYRTPEKIKTKGRGKNGKMLYKYTLLDFKKYYDLWMNERKEKNFLDNEFLFIRQVDGGTLTTAAFDSYTDMISEILGKPFYFHSLRHQLCSRLFRIGLPSDVIQEYFGWSSSEMLQIYNDNEASESFGKFFTNDGIKGSDVNGF